MAILKVGGTQIASSSGSDVTLDNVALGSSVTGAGSWIKLQSEIPDGTADVLSVIMGMVSGSTVFTSTYKVYKIIGSGLKSNDDNIQLSARYMQSGSDLSVNYEHAGQYIHTNDSGSSIYYDNQTGQDQVHLTNFIGNATGESVSFEITIFDPAGTTNWKAMFIETFMGHKDGQGRMDAKWARNYNNVNAIEALRIYFNGGEFGSQGSFSLYGVV